MFADSLPRSRTRETRDVHARSRSKGPLEVVLHSSAPRVGSRARLKCGTRLGSAEEKSRENSKLDISEKTHIQLMIANWNLLIFFHPAVGSQTGRNSSKYLCEDSNDAEVRSNP